MIWHEQLGIRFFVNLGKRETLGLQMAQPLVILLVFGWIQGGVLDVFSIGIGTLAGCVASRQSYEIWIDL